MARTPKLPAGINTNCEKTVDHYVIYASEDTWHHHPIKLPIKMIRKTGKSSFSCINTEMNIRVENDSIDEVMIEVDNIVKGRAGITWKPKLAIEMASVVIQNPRDASSIMKLVLEIEVTALDLGIDLNGDEWERIQGKQFISKAENREGFEAWFDDDPQDTWRDKDRSSVLIDDTPENRIALKNLALGFKEFLKKVYDLLEPDQVEATVTQLFKSSAFLLPGAEKD